MVDQSLEQRIFDLEQRLAVLEARLNQISINSQRAMETQGMYLATGGLNGTTKTWARSNHSH